MAAIRFDEVSKVYPDGTRAVDELELAIGEGEFMVFVGPSGCGKTSALRMVAGLEEVSEGTIRIGDRIVNEVPAKDRDIAMVFQNYALYPHMTVAQNLAFGLKLRKLNKSEVGRRIRATAAALDLEEHLDRKPAALSGGQRQRVALGRAIVREPDVFLMDEPLSNLDAALRVQTRAEIQRLQKQLGTTTIYVTHDQVEAMTMGDRIAVMKKGVLQQIGTPEEVYTRPANVFVASFIGSPAMNVLPAPDDRYLRRRAACRLPAGARPARRGGTGVHLLRGGRRGRRIPRRRAARSSLTGRALARGEAPRRTSTRPRHARGLRGAGSCDCALRCRERRGDRSTCRSRRGGFFRHLELITGRSASRGKARSGLEHPGESALSLLGEPRREARAHRALLRAPFVMKGPVSFTYECHRYPSSS